MGILAQQLVNGVALGAIYALIALGYTMVYGVVELINFAHGDVYAFGSFCALAILGGLGATAGLHGWPLAAALAATLLASMLLCGVLGVAIERLAYRRLRNAPKLAPLITAIGVSFILQNVMQLWRGPAPIPFPDLLPDVALRAGSVSVSLKQGLVVACAIALMVGLNLFVGRTRAGRAMRAVAQDRDAARLMGIDVDATIALTFFVGGALAGAAGTVGGLYYGSTWCFNGFAAGLKAFTAAVLGGIGNVTGAMLGGLLIGLIEALSTQLLSSQWSDVVVFLVLVLTLVARPSGLLGESLPEKV